MVIATFSFLGTPSGARGQVHQGPPGSGSVVRVQDAEVAYEDLGEGTPVVMLHGFGVDRRTMKGCMAPIFSKRSGWRRLYFDLPGMGVTDPVQSVGSSDAMLDFALEFINKVLADQKFLVVGESYGGYLAQGVVYKHPERVLGMLLIGSMVVADDTKRDLEPRTVIEKDDSLLQELEPYEREAFEHFSVVQNRKNWERFKAEMFSGMEVRSSDYLHTIRRSPTTYAFSFDIERLPRRFEGPSLILAGRQDHLVGYKDLWRIVENYPRSSFILLDRAGHALQIEQEEVFNSLVIEWLDRVEGGVLDH
jgi:pimeloyl-ACP methyl ester carboxylesterase